MKVLLSERNFKGHRKTYMEWLAKIHNVDFYVLAPDNFGIKSDHYFKYEPTKEAKSFKVYLKWIQQMKKIAKENKIDVIHILDGDSIMRWFGYGLGSIKVKKIIITYHHFFPGKARKFSYWLMCHNKNRLCVAHTASVEQSLKKCGLKNVVRNEYPAFNFESIESRNSVFCKEKYKVPIDVPVIGIIGGLSTYKNIIPFLNMMNEVNREFHILICGKESGVTREQIEKIVKSYSNKITLHIGFLSDQEYEEAIVASDIIFCIYSHEFDGASGPLTDGVCAGKLILACRHGSLGEIVSQNLLGIIADCDDEKDMLNKTELALSRAKDFKYGVQAQKYREGLKPLTFQSIYKRTYNE